MKRVLAILGALLALVLVLLLVLPMLFRDRIAQRAKLEVNWSGSGDGAGITLRRLAVIPT